MPSKLKVALVALHFAEYSIRLAMALATDIDVLLILYKKNADDELGPDWESSATHPNLKIVTLIRPKSPLAVLRNSYKLVATIRRYGADLIHFQEDTRDEIFLSLPFFGAMPIILTVHDPVTHTGVDSDRMKFSRLRLYRSRMRRRADAAITHGDLLVADLVHECQWLRGSVWSIPHGPLGLEKLPTPLEYSNSLRLLFFGRIQRYKGLKFFVEAVVKLRDEGLPVVGVIAGRGDDLEPNRTQMIAAGCFEILDHYIPAADIPKMFKTARAVVLPYVDGTQSGVAALALGYARPVVATTVGSIPEMVRDGQNGLLVPPSDSTALTDALRRVVTDDLLWSQLSEGAIELRDGALSWHTISARTRDAYLGVLQRRQQ